MKDPLWWHMSLKASDRFLWRGYPPGPREAVHLDLRGWLHDPSLPRGTEGHSGTAVGATLVSRESRPLLHLEKIEFTPDKMCETNLQLEAFHKERVY